MLYHKPMRQLVLLGMLSLGFVEAQTALPLASFEGQVIYQIMPDRFFDGDKTNNLRVDRSNLRAWHGGDLKGITQKISYLQKLGVTAIWMTPIYKQQDKNSFDTAAYHGYWPADFRAVDDHFGKMADFDELMKQAQGKGFRVVLDQVINHYGYEADAVKQHPDWFNDPQACKNTQNTDVNCPLAGLPDLKQSEPPVQEMLLGNADFWREKGVDGFRYDAIKHVESSFLKQLLTNDRNAGTWTLGEWYGAETATVADWQRAGFDSLFLFSLQQSMKDSIMGGQGLERVANVLARQDELQRAGEVAIFLDNHDTPRFAQGSLFEDEGRARTKYGLRALMTLRGVPVIYQGTEIAMRGGADPDNRRDMRFENQWTAPEKAVFDIAANAIAVRKASPALSRGALKLLPVPAQYASDLLLFTRELNGKTVLVAWHNGKTRASFSLKLSSLKWPTQTLKATNSLFSDGPAKSQQAKVSITGQYLNLSLPSRDASAFSLR